MAGTSEVIAAPGKISATLIKRYSSGFLLDCRFEAPIDSAKVTALFGPSGAGKTSVLRCLAGLEPLSSGKITFGEDVWNDVAAGIFVPPQKRRIGYVFQDYALFPHLTVEGNVGYALRHLPRPERHRRIEEMLALLKIEKLARRYAGELSGGEQQRVALARALVRAPRLLLLDEPLTAVDEPTRQLLRTELRGLLKKLGIPAVLVTHDWTEALALGDRLVVISAGRILQCGTPQDVFSRPAHVDVAAALGTESVETGEVMRRHEGMLEVRAGKTLLHVADRGGDYRSVYVCIRAEDVTLEIGAPIQSSARNHLQGTVVDITPRGLGVLVELDVGIRLFASITRQALHDLHLAPGSSVAASVKASAIHLIPRPSV
ncbi:MAG: molybdenum ABC transporter ATP-binding protein [Acidobacteria bacterium]|nr:molybdenum ABC transporter ATP-binding protein [Acidobacteriota bacterium]